MTAKRMQWMTAVLPVLICFAVMAALTMWWMREYQQSAFTHISKFCEVMIKNHPEAEQNILSDLKEYHTLTENEMQDTVFLQQYGYERSSFCKEMEKEWLLPACMAWLLTAGLFLAAGWYRERQKCRRITELTAYLEQVNAGTAGILIQTKEDDFSHLQDELYKTVTELYQTRETAVKAKSSFADNLANLAHQLKSSVTALSLSVQLLKREIPQMRAEQMDRQLERLTVLQEALLTLSKIDAGTLVLEAEETDVYTALQLAADHLSGLLQKEQISVWIPEKECAGFVGDLDWTMEALYNLMKNCAEHSPVGGTIYCDYAENPIYTEIRIWDEGEGFCGEDIPHLFERFYRGKRAGGNGAGIGLALAKSVFELQNGNVTARNLPEGGACFEIRIYRH